MNRPVRSAYDGRQAEFSALAESENPVEENMTRQEMSQETDVNYFLSRYGMPVNQGATYGEADYDLDYQGALHAIMDAKEAHRRLDPQLRSRFPDWVSLLEAVERGEIKPVEQPETPVEQAETPKPE